MNCKQTITDHCFILKIKFSPENQVSSGIYEKIRFKGKFPLILSEGKVDEREKSEDSEEDITEMGEWQSNKNKQNDFIRKSLCQFNS